MGKVLTIIGAVVVAAAIIAVIALVMAIPTMLLVNYLFSKAALTAVFGTASISFWKAFWLTYFFGIAFKCSSSSKW